MTPDSDDTLSEETAPVSPDRGRGARGPTGAAAGAPRRTPTAHRDHAGPRRRVPRPGRRQRARRDRRRARLRLPLLLAGLPDPAPSRGRGHDPDRPDRLRVDAAAAGRAGGHRVDPARRDPGPALPERARPGTRRAVRHRARRPAPGLPAGGPGHARRDAARLPDEEGALRGRLVDPARCRGRGSSTPRSTSRYWSSCARSWPDELHEAGKDEWARQEFEWLRGFTPYVRSEPWRRTSGLHRVRGRRLLGAVRELWEERDELARARDVSPGRIIGDNAIVAAALADPVTKVGPAVHQGLPRSRCPAVRRPLARGADPRARPEPRTTSRSVLRAPTVHRRRVPGPNATRRRPSASPSPATAWPDCPRSSRCRPRTCSRPTRCAG